MVLNTTAGVGPIIESGGSHQTIQFGMCKINRLSIELLV